MTPPDPCQSRNTWAREQTFTARPPTTPLQAESVTYPTKMANVPVGAFPSSRFGGRTSSGSKYRSMAGNPSSLSLEKMCLMLQYC